MRSGPNPTKRNHSDFAARHYRRLDSVGRLPCGCGEGRIERSSWDHGSSSRSGAPRRQSAEPGAAAPSTSTSISTFIAVDLGDNDVPGAQARPQLQASTASVAPARLVNTGTDYVTILKSLERYGNWLGAHHP